MSCPRSSSYGLVLLFCDLDHEVGPVEAFGGRMVAFVLRETALHSGRNFLGGLASVD